MARTPGPFSLKTQFIKGCEDDPPLPYATIDGGEKTWDEDTNSGFHLAGIMSAEDAQAFAAVPELIEVARASRDLLVAIRGGCKDPLAIARADALLTLVNGALTKAGIG